MFDKLPSGRWQARYPGPDGLARPAPTTFPTKTDATVWLSHVEAAEARGEWFDPDAGRCRSERMRAVDRGAPLVEADGRQVRALLRLHLQPQLGMVDLVDITPARVRAWRAGLLADAGAVDRRPAYRLLRAVLQTALDDELMRRNPCRIKGADQDNSPSGRGPVAEVYAIAERCGIGTGRWC